MTMFAYDCMGQTEEAQKIVPEMNEVLNIASDIENQPDGLTLEETIGQILGMIPEDVGDKDELDADLNSITSPLMTDLPER